MNSGRPELLGPGWHGVLEPLRSWHGAVPLTQEVIQFSTVEVVTVKDGFAGLAWDRGEPVLLPPTSSAETLATCNQELTTIGIKINKIAIVKLDITDVEVLRALAKGATIAVAIREKRKVAEVEAESTVLHARANAEGRRLEAQAEAYAEKQRADAQLYYAEKVAESAQTLGPSGLGGQLMQLHASGDVLGKTETSLVIAGGGSDVASTLLGNAGVVNMDGRK